MLCVHTQPMRIQVSEATAALLQGKRFILSERGQVEVKVSRVKPLPIGVEPLNIWSRLGPAILSFIERLSSLRGYDVLV